MALFWAISVLRAAKMRDHNLLFLVAILKIAVSSHVDTMPACDDGPGIEIPSLSGP